jgi:hypothetical protein
VLHWRLCYLYLFIYSKSELKEIKATRYFTYELRVCRAIIRKSILHFKIPEHQKSSLFGELCFVWALWAFSQNQLGEITLVKVRDRTTFLLKTF